MKSNQIFRLFHHFILSSYHNYQNFLQFLQVSLQDTSHTSFTSFTSLTSSHFSSPSLKKDIRDFSQQFRDLLNQFIESLASEEISQLCNESDLDQIDLLIDLLNDTSKLWNACEIFLISPSDMICSQAIQWIQAVLDDFDILDITDPTKAFDASPQLSQEYSDYWILIFDLLLRGKLEGVWELLRSHPDIISREGTADVFELESILTSHPLLCENNPSLNGYGQGPMIRELNNQWLQWRQRVESFLGSARPNLCHIIPELSSAFNLFRGDIPTISHLLSLTNRHTDWKTDVLCSLLYCHPSLTRNELIRAIEESITRVRRERHQEMERESCDGSGEIIRGLLRGNLSSLLETIFQRVHASMPHPVEEIEDDSMELHGREDGRPSAITKDVDLILKSSILSINTHLCAIFHILGLLSGIDKDRKSENGEDSLLEHSTHLLVDSFLSLNLSPEMCISYLCHFSPVKGRERCKSIILSIPVSSDDDVAYLTSLLRSLHFYSESNKLLVQRGEHYLQKSLRNSTDISHPSTQLYRKGGYETKALLFFLSGSDMKRSRALIDHCLRRCILSTTQYPEFASYFPMVSPTLQDLLPIYSEQFNSHEQLGGKLYEKIVASSEVIGEVSVEVTIGSGLLTAIDNGIGSSLCGREAMCLRYYIESIQSLLGLSSISSSISLPSLEEKSQKMYADLQTLQQASYPLQFLLTSFHSLHSSLPLSVTSSSLSTLCPQRYYLYLLSLILSLDNLYHTLHGTFESILQALPLSPIEYDQWTEKSEELPVSLWKKEEIEVMLQMIHTFQLSHQQRKIVEKNTTILADFHQRLLTMYQKSVYVSNHEQYSSSLSSSQNNPNTFSVFRTKNSRYSTTKSQAKVKGNEEEKKDSERKTNFQLHLPSSTVPTSSSMSTPRKGKGGAGRTNEYTSRVSQYLTVAPSSLSCRLAISSSN